MKLIKRMYPFLLIFTFYSNAQQQQHIPWPSLADSPWPIGRGDAQATGRSKYVGPRTPNVIWRKDMPLGIFHGPVIGYNDNLFFGTRALNSGGENYFYSIDKNGEDIWTFTTQGNRANVAGPTITNNGTIYFASIGGGGLYALNPDGTLKWENNRFMYTYYTRFISVAKNHNIYIPWLDTLYILEPENGNIIDSLYTPLINDHDIVFSMQGDTIFYFSGRIFTQDIKKLNALTLVGNQLWSIELNHNYGTPLVDNENKVYVYGLENYIGYVYCINPDSTVNWRFQMNANERFENYSSPTIDRNGNIIFQTSTADSGYVTSVDYYGNLNWKTAVGRYFEDGAFINSGLVCDAEGKIYCGSSYGESTNFWCLDSDGTILWKLDLEGYEYDTSPAINSDGTLYIGTHLSSLFQNHQRNLIAINDTGTSGVYNEQEMMFRLYQNYPNPFNPITHIDYTLIERTNVTLKVFNIMGEEIKTLVNEETIPGYYSVIFDGKDLPSGVYFYELVTDKIRLTKKMILLR